MKKIGFDFDGVIADTDKIKKEYFDSQNIQIKNFNKSDIFNELENKYSSEYILQIYRKMSEYVFREETIKRTYPVEGAIESIKKLAKQFEIYIITARNYVQLVLVKEWLKMYDINNEIKAIISSSEEKKHKLQICKENNIAFFCDDDIRHLSYENSDNIVKILFNNNKLLKNYNIHSVESWKDLLKYIR